MQNLVINTESNLYKYYLWIRSMWGKHEHSQRSSLCNIVQTIIWYTIAMIVASPFIIMGWCLLKFYRWFYKTSEKMGLTFITDSLDIIKFSNFINDMSEAMDLNPLMPLITVSIISYAFLGLIATAIILLSFGFTGLIHALPYIPLFLWHGLLTLGSAIFVILFAIGLSNCSIKSTEISDNL